MIPGCSRNWRRTSNTMAPAARVTALIARPENMNTTAAPRIRPNRTFGATICWLNIDWTNWSDLGLAPICPTAVCQASV